MLSLFKRDSFTQLLNVGENMMQELVKFTFFISEILIECKVLEDALIIFIIDSNYKEVINIHEVIDGFHILVSK